MYSFYFRSVFDFHAATYERDSSKVSTNYTSILIDRTNAKSDYDQGTGYVYNKLGRPVFKFQEG